MDRWRQFLVPQGCASLSRSQANGLARSLLPRKEIEVDWIQKPDALAQRWRRKMLKVLALAAAVSLVAALPSAGLAEDHQVLMLNKDSQGRPMQFEPAFLKIAAGDTVTFVAKDKGHNTEALADRIPAGAELWKGKINEEITVTFEADGHYAYKCAPHAALGMVGLIEVGEAGAPDPALADGIPGKGKVRMQELITEAQGN